MSDMYMNENKTAVLLNNQFLLQQVLDGSFDIHHFGCIELGREIQITAEQLEYLKIKNPTVKFVVWG